MIDSSSVSEHDGFSRSDTPLIVPWTTEPFLSSIVTVSLLSFIKNLIETGVSIRSLRSSNGKYSVNVRSIRWSVCAIHLTSFMAGYVVLQVDLISEVESKVPLLIIVCRLSKSNSLAAWHRQMIDLHDDACDVLYRSSFYFAQWPLRRTYGYTMANCHESLT
jgi:hypothetical protein